jgi:hypothetical protein
MAGKGGFETRPYKRKGRQGNTLRALVAVVNNPEK